LSILLNRASQKISNIRVEIAKVDLQVECLQEVVKQKQEEALALENELSILQGKLQGIREIKALVLGELEKRLATLTELHKQAEKETASSGEESGPIKN
jgi:chromosome segregation ATPase